MRRTSNLMFSFVMMLLISVPMVRLAGGTPATPTLYVYPSKNTGWPLDTAGGHGYNDLLVDIRVSDVTNLYGWGFWLHWNPAVLKLIACYEGTFIKGPFRYETYPEAHENNITVTNPVNAYDENTDTYANFAYGKETDDWYYSSPTMHTKNISMVEEPTWAYDMDNTTAATFIYAEGTEANPYRHFTLKALETYNYGEIVQVDLGARFNATAAIDDQYRIVYYVSPSAEKQVLIDWTSDGRATDTTTWANIAEPNNGLWSWDDVNNLNFMVETKLVGTTDMASIYVHEMWLLVKYKTPIGHFNMMSFDIPYYPYSISRVDLKIKCSAQTATDDQYRIVYYVDPSPEAQVLVDWTNADLPLNTYTYNNLSEPNDGNWGEAEGFASWADISRINFVVETKQVGTFDNVEFRVYEAWAVVKYYRGTFGESILYEATGYVNYGSTALGEVDGATGSGTIAMLRFVVLTSGTSTLEFAAPGPVEVTKLLSPTGFKMPHTAVNGTFTAPPWIEDINGDGYVDITDISLVGIGWGKKSTDPDWGKYKDADVYTDDVIDIEDLSKVAVKWSIESYL